MILVSLLVIAPTLPVKYEQKPTLKLGDKAPVFKAAGFVKGTSIKSLVKGKTYVIEFWATWCSPCIGAMPHLSDVADKYKSKAIFISVNTWDAKGETLQAHTSKVKKWVDKNSKNMRYNVALDDTKDSIGTAWIKASGQVGIPCTFIVNDEGKVAWIGDPMKVEAPLKAVLEKKWSIDAYRSTLEKETQRDRTIIQTERESMLAFQKKMKALIEANDRAAIDKFVNGSSERAQHVISVCLPNHADMAFDYWKKAVSDKSQIPTSMWAGDGSIIIVGLKDKAKQSELLKLSESLTKRATKKDAAAVYMYHGQALAVSGDKKAATNWFEKAKAAVSTYEPATQRDSILQSIQYMVESMNLKK